LKLPVDKFLIALLIISAAGVIFQNPAKGDSAQTVPLYRFYSQHGTDHFYTANQQEYETLKVDDNSGNNNTFLFEGIQACVFPPNYRFEGTLAWHRYLQDHGSWRDYDHFYTTWQDGRRDTSSNIWDYKWEGIAAYIYSPDGTRPENTVPLHRYYSASAVDHLYTLPGAEKDAWDSDPGLTYEGVEGYVYEYSGGCPFVDTGSTGNSTAGGSTSLTGIWTSNDGGLYYIRQIGDVIWWLGVSPDDGRTWTNVFHGRLIGDEIVGEWADLPRGEIRNHGTLFVRVKTNPAGETVLEKWISTGGFGANTWTGQNAEPRPLQIDPQTAGTYNLIGVWSGNDGGSYYVTNLGNRFPQDVWWVGLSGDSGLSWTNVFHGTWSEGRIQGDWADVPHGRASGYGSMTMNTIYKNCEYADIERTSVTGGFGGSHWTRTPRQVEPGTGVLCPPITLSEMKDQETFQNLLLTNDRNELLSSIDREESNKAAKIHEVAEKLRILTGTKAIGSQPEFADLPIQSSADFKYDIHTLWIPKTIERQKYAILLVAFADPSTNKLTTDVITYDASIAYGDQTYYSKEMTTLSGVSVVIIPANTFKHGSSNNPAHYSLYFDIQSSIPNSAKSSPTIIPMAEAISATEPQDIVVVPEFAQSGLTISLSIGIVVLFVVVHMASKSRRGSSKTWGL
jgi:hypothetical protein